MMIIEIMIMKLIIILIKTIIITISIKVRIKQNLNLSFYDSMNVINNLKKLGDENKNIYKWNDQVTEIM